VLLLLNGLLYIIGETVTAFAWENPPYDYGAHLVSDLGAQVCGEFQGRRRCSPLYPLMNITFITLGAVLFAAILLLARLLGRRARVHILFAALFAIGMLGVGLVQSSAATIANGTAVIHVVGSCIAMIVANVMAIVVGVQSRHVGAPHWYRVTSIVMGAIGLAGFTGVAVIGGVAVIEATAPGAILERVAVYAILVWWLITSLTLLVGARDNALIIRRAVRQESA
jgi:hypothetical protein